MWHGSCSVWQRALVSAAPPAADVIGTAARNATCMYMHSITATATDLSLAAARHARSHLHTGGGSLKVHVLLTHSNM